MRASRTAMSYGRSSGKTPDSVMACRKEVAVVGGDEAVEIYVTQISRNFVQINTQIRMLRKECEIAARLLRDIE